MLLKIYSVYYLLFYLAYTFSPANLKLCGTWEWVDMAFMLVALTGMFSYSFGFRILVRKFWDYFFWLFIIYELIYMTWLQMPLLAKLNIADQALASDAVNVVMMSPLAYMLFRLQQRWNVIPVKKK